MTGHTDETVKHIADGLSVVTVVGTLALNEVLDCGGGSDV